MDADFRPMIVFDEATKALKRQLADQELLERMWAAHLPKPDGDELEIARVKFGSVNGDAIAIYARQLNQAVEFRIVDEYDGECLAEPTQGRSDEVPTLGELCSFVMSAGLLAETVNDNWENGGSESEKTVEDFIDSFVSCSSLFYPGLDGAIRELICAALAEEND